MRTSTCCSELVAGEEDSESELIDKKGPGVEPSSSPESPGIATGFRTFTRFALFPLGKSFELMQRHRAMIKVYAYKGCSTCRNAIKWLTQHHIPFVELPIRETPPSIAELKAMLAAQGNDLKRLFNTSGQDYRALGIKDKLSSLSVSAALELLASNGNLIKRPFALNVDHTVGLVGFKEPEWTQALR